MPVDNHRDSAGENNRNASQPPPRRARRRFVTRRNTILVVIGLACAVAALILVSLIAYRLGFVDRYIAGQVKDTLANYGVRAEIRSFHTSLSPQSVELQGVELYDAKSGEKIGKKAIILRWKLDKNLTVLDKYLVASSGRNEQDDTVAAVLSD